MDGLAVFDEETGMHDISDKSMAQCYWRAFYFVSSTLTSVGYGDISPYTDIEFCYQILICFCGVCLNAMICQSLYLCLKSWDSFGDFRLNGFRSSIDKYILLRKLSGGTRNEVISNLELSWETDRQICSSHNTCLKSNLPFHLSCEISYELYKDSIKCIPILNSFIQRKKISNFLVPICYPKDSFVYTPGDLANDVYFVRKGVVKITVPKAANHFSSTYLHWNKLHACGRDLGAGCHFGELCLFSHNAARLGGFASCVTDVELYSISKTDLWYVLTFMTAEEQKKFIVSLFTTINGKQHTAYPIVNTSAEQTKTILSDSISHLNDMATEVLRNIIDEGIRHEMFSSKKFGSDVFVPYLDQEIQTARDVVAQPEIENNDKNDSIPVFVPPLLYTSDAVIYQPEAQLEINPNNMNVNSLVTGPSIGLVPLTKRMSPSKQSINESLKMLGITVMLKELLSVKKSLLTNEDVVNAFYKIGINIPIESAEAIIARFNVVGSNNDIFLQDLISGYVKSPIRKSKKISAFKVGKY